MTFSEAFDRSDSIKLTVVDGKINFELFNNGVKEFETIGNQEVLLKWGARKPTHVSIDTQEITLGG